MNRIIFRGVKAVKANYYKSALVSPPMAVILYRSGLGLIKDLTEISKKGANLTTRGEVILFFKRAGYYQRGFSLKKSEKKCRNCRKLKP